jgi:signal transduction histidine kinase
MKQELRAAGRALAHLSVGAGVSLLCYLMFGVLLFAAVMAVTVIGAGAFPEVVLMLRRLAGFERRRVARWAGAEVPEAYRPLVGALRVRVRAAATDPGTYRDLRWSLAQLGYGLLLWYAAMVVAMVALLVDGLWCGLLRRRAVLLPVLPKMADAAARLSRGLLLPSPAELGMVRRIEELTVSRADAVAVHGAELRRIERDLHDGAQARLVALSMRVGLARRAYQRSPDGGRELLDQAQDLADEALAELRQVVRAIHPPVLTDRGLVGAVRALAAGSALVVEVTDEGVEAASRPPAAVEAAGYFVVAEALTNAAKHSGAEHAEVRLERGARTLNIRIMDEGCGGVDERGGADERSGTGLLGMRRRVAALDGQVRIDSPPGGPTVIEVELPCVW